MKVLNIIHRYPPAIGGSEFWCRNVCRFLASRGITTKVATINLNNIEEFFRKGNPNDKYIKFGKYDNDNGVSVVRYNLWSFASNKLSAKILKILLKDKVLGKTEIGEIFRHSPHSFEMYSNLFFEVSNSDIVFLHTLPYFHNLVGYTFARLCKRPVIIAPYFHAGHTYYEKEIFFKLMANCDAVIVLTEHEKNCLIARGVHSNKIFISGCMLDEDFLNDTTYADERILSGVSILEKYNIKMNKSFKKIIFIGRKEAYKGVFTLIEAARRLSREKEIDIDLFLIGADRPDFDKWYTDLTDLGKLNIIKLGEISNQEKYLLLKSSDVLVLPSKYESFGIVFLEAWKHEKPVIGSDEGAIPEVIKGAGLCVKYGDVEDLKEKIKMVLFNKELALRLGTTGREKLNTIYSMNKVGGVVINVCNRIRKSKRRILIASCLFPPYVAGGAEIVAYGQARLLKQMGFEIKVFAGRRNNIFPQYNSTKENGEFEVMRINLHDSDFNYRYVNFNKEKIQKEFSRFIHKVTPDIVHFHNIHFLSLNIVSECYKMRIPTVMTLHDYWGICPKNILITDRGFLCDKTGQECLHCHIVFHSADGRCLSALERNNLFMHYINMVDLVISPSKYLLSRFIDCGLIKEKGLYINNGIDINRFKCKTLKHSGRIRFGYIGQIIEHKGLENLLRGISLLSTDEKNRIFLTIVGAGEETFTKYCKRLSEELSLNNCVRFIGKVGNNRVPRIIAGLDMLIVPSIWPENSPVTIMEALASGVPVLASNIGGIPELIQDRVNGLLFEYNNPASLSQKISEVIKNPTIISSMSPACIKYAENNNLIKQVKIIADYYEKVMNQRHYN